MNNTKCNLRGIIGKDLSEKEIKKIARLIVDCVNKNKYIREIIVGKDNRGNSDYVVSIIKSILLKSGISVYEIGIATTPELMFLTKKFKFDLGVMITGSHNLYEYNGLKIYNKFGEMIELNSYKPKYIATKKYGVSVNIEKYKDLYFRELKNKLNSNKIKCVFDCANGSSLEIIRKVFPKQQIIGVANSGEEINKGCGSENLDKIRAICKRNKKIGFAFDGDGDRVIAIDEEGEIVDGDKIVYILATQRLKFGDRVVGNKISSLGLEISLRRLGVGLIREKVGTKYITNRMKSENINLGGEVCGHIFISQQGASDGIVVAIELLNILNRTSLKFKELLRGYKDTYHIVKSIELEKCNNFDEFEEIDNKLRVIVRKSETEPQMRIFVEGEDKDIVNNRCEDILKKYYKQ